MQDTCSRLICIKIVVALLLMIFVVVECRVRCQNGTTPEQDIVDRIFANYRKMLPQNVQNSDNNDTRGQESDAVLVEIEIHIQDISSLNEITSDFEIDVLFSQLWHDPALAFSHMNPCKSNITMETHRISQIWTPNTCIFNSKKSTVHASPTENIMFILYENGTIWINYRLQVKAPCMLDLRSFPFDVQKCELIFESYSYNSEEVRLRWFEFPLPVQLMKPVNLPDFDLLGWVAENQTLPYPNGLWDRLKVTFKFRRRFGFYILQAYIPTYLTIMVSWVSFCMDSKALPARTTVGVSSLLALTFQFGNILKNLPRVSYIKAMDVWMLGCISFVFATMVELAAVCYTGKCYRMNNRIPAYDDDDDDDDDGFIYDTDNSKVSSGLKRMSNGRPSTGQACNNRVSSIGIQPSSQFQTVDDDVWLHRTSQQSNESDPCVPYVIQWLSFQRAQGKEAKRQKRKRVVKWFCSRFKCTPENIDKFSMIMFPLTFTIFNATYWWCYVGNGQYITSTENLTLQYDVV